MQAIRVLRRFLFLLPLLCAAAALGQGPPRNVPGRGIPQPGGGPGQNALQQQQEEEPDTFPIYVLYAHDFLRLHPFTDSLLDDRFNQWDLVRKREQDYKNLGVPGSAHQPIVYAPRLRRGFDPGLHQYDLYLFSASELPFYRLERAFTQAGFNRGSEQTNGAFSLQFSRNFANGLNVSLDYNRVSHPATNVLFPNQRGRNTSLGAGFWLQSKDGRYQGFFAFSDNKFERDDNGGILAEPVREGAFFTPSSAQVNLRQAGTRHRHQEFLYTQYYSLLGGSVADSATGTSPGRQLLLRHQISYRSSRYKFFDPQPAEDAAYYRSFQTDNRGIRNFLTHDKLENRFYLIGSGGRESAQTGFPLELGLIHAWHQIGQEPLDSSLQEVFLHGRLALRPFAKVSLLAEAFLGVLGSPGDYQVNATLSMPLGKAMLFQGQLTNQLYSPTLLQQQLFVTQQQVWQNDFSKTLESNLSGRLVFPGLRLELGGAYHLLNNLIYFDTERIARQTGIPVSVGQLFVKHRLRLWKIYLDNQWTLQAASGNVLRVPAVFGKHSLFFQGKLFKVLESRLGLDLRYTSSYFSDQYFPLTGQFHLQDEQEVLFYPQVDVFFNMKVTKFRAFVKWENLSASFLGGRLLYQVPAHPWPPVSGLRLGFKWRFSE